jgi:diguanylate cyclase (GGDEF)-like protein
VSLLHQDDDVSERDTTSRRRLIVRAAGAAAVLVAVATVFRAAFVHAVPAISAPVVATIAIAVLLCGLVGAIAFLRSRRERDLATARELHTLRETTLLLQDRAGELEMMMRLAESLGEALDPESLKKVIREQLQPLLKEHEIWLSTKEGGWQPVIGSRPPEAGLGRPSKQAATWHTFPLISQQNLVGVLGVRHDKLPLTPAQHEILHAAAALLTVAVKNVQLFRKVKDLAVLEPLTGCVTRHHGIERLSAELRRAQRSHMPVSVVMLDIDHFKSVNDKHGHLCGDQVLAGVGRILRETLRVSDERCRYGGEEFLLVLPDTTVEGALRVAESLRVRFAATPLLCARGAVRFTASLGVAQALPGEAEVNGLLGRADAALYAAKAAGRNRVCSQISTTPAGSSRIDPIEGIRVQERRDARRPDRRQTLTRGRRASDWQQAH